MAKLIYAPDDDHVLVHDEPAEAADRGRLKQLIARRYNTRLHMTLILLASGFASMVASWSLLHLGVHAMLVRYPVAITASYLMFLFGVWVWLRATGLERAGESRTGQRLADGVTDLPISGGSGGSNGGGGSLPGLGRGGGTFDGGGASASFAEQRAPMALAMSDTQAAPASSAKGSSSKSSFGIGLDIDADGIVLLVLAALLVLAIFLCSGYLVYSAPDVLAEAAFGATLTGTLSRPSARHSPGGWVAGVVRKTWWPYAIVLVLALAFAGWSATKFPRAATFKEAIAAAVHSSQEK